MARSSTRIPIPGSPSWFTSLGISVTSHTQPTAESCSELPGLPRPAGRRRSIRSGLTVADFVNNGLLRPCILLLRATVGETSPGLDDGSMSPVPAANYFATTAAWRAHLVPTAPRSSRASTSSRAMSPTVPRCGFGDLQRFHPRPIRRSAVVGTYRFTGLTPVRSTRPSMTCRAASTPPICQD